MSLAIILVGYNRPRSMLRLFESVMKARHVADVDVIVSIDYSGSQEAVREIVESSDFFAPNVKFRCFENRQGLREHILACGDLTAVYDAVVVLEDDIVVSGSFLDFVVSAIKYVDDNQFVAGISLYSPTSNEMSLLPFVPKPTGFDNYYLQSAQSWGQCWTKKMWSEFREWYRNNSGVLVKAGDMPARIYSWPESSWKKYYMKYLVDTGRTFFYPDKSFSTNCSDIGQHNKVVSPIYQVSLVVDKFVFKFGSVREVPCYDVFFERVGMKFEGEDVCLDIYGTKTESSSRFFLSSKRLAFRVVESYGLALRPQEDNFIFKSDGDDIFLYELGAADRLSIKESYYSYSLANYHSNLSWRHSLIYTLGTLKSRLVHKIKRSHV